MSASSAMSLPMTHPVATPMSTNHFKGRIAFLSVAVVPLLGLLFVMGVWIARPIYFDAESVLHITGTRPGAGESHVLPNGFIAADVNLPNAGHGVDSRTLTPQTVRLTRLSDGAAVKSVVNTSGGGDSIVLQPVETLAPQTRYAFEVTAGLKDTAGTPFEPHRMTFTTAAGSSVSDYPVAFDKIALPTTQDIYTGLALGPDGRLYAGTFDGKIVRFDINADGALSAPLIIPTIQRDNGGPRLITGVCFDPASTASNLIAWVSHGIMALENAAHWSGKITRLSGPNLQTCQDIVIGLPRGYRDHLNNQMNFGPDGALYFNQGSMTGMGAPDKKWNFRDETPLSAAVLRLDPRAVAAAPLNVKTRDGGGTYDPSSAAAPLTVYASGTRVAFDLVWHSNGSLYVPINGSAKGGNTPGSDRSVDALRDVSTQPDLLLRVEKGGYYGHPNPARGEYVLNGGNPTRGEDPIEVREYSAGTKPHAGWRTPAYVFGKSVSPNGVLEYKSNALGGALRGKLLITRYSGGDDIVILTPGARGEISESITGVSGLTQFVDPLDLLEDPRSGCLYIAEFGGRKLTLLRPREGGRSKVFREQVGR